MDVIHVYVKKITLLQSHLAQCTAGNLETEHAQFIRRGDALHLNETRPLIADLNSAARDTLRRRNLRRKFFQDLI